MDRTRLLFVSHSHEDDPFCQRLIADLRANLGEDAVWYDISGGLHGGDDWWNRIIAEITERPYFLVVLSPNASASKWVPEEMAIAFRQKVELGKHLLPVRLADSPRREDWKSIQEFDFTQISDPTRYADALAEVVRAIDSKLTTPVINAPSVSPSAAAPERLLSPSERLAQEIHTAYGREHWSDVLDKTEILVERGAMTPALWRERASAAFALSDNNGGLAVIKQALKAGVDDADTLLLYTRLAARTGDDQQAAEILTRAYALVPLGDTATRLAILGELTIALARLGRWEEFGRRVTDGRRMASDDPLWALREVEALIHAQRYDKAAAAVSALPSLPAGMDTSLVLPAWRAAILSAAMGPTNGENWAICRALFDAAAATGIAPSAIARWRFEFPHFVPLVTLSDQSDELDTPPVWSPTGTRLATTHRDGTTQIWDTTSGRLLSTLPVRRKLDGSSNASGIVWSPDGARLARGAGETGTIWDAASGRLLATLSRPGPTPTGIRRVLSGSSPDVPLIDWSLQIEAWSPNGLWLAASSRNPIGVLDKVWGPWIQVWDAASGQVLITPPNQLDNDIVNKTAAWSPDGARIATAGNYSHAVNAAQVWDAASGRLLATLSGGLMPVAWSPDGARLATASEEGPQVWDAASGRPLITLAGRIGVNDFAWSPDGARLVICSNSGSDSPDSTGVWEVASGRRLAILSGDGRSIRRVSWTPNGARLVGTMRNNRPMMWNATSGEEIGNLGVNLFDNVHESSPIWPYTAWSPDGARLVITQGKRAIIFGEE